MKSGWLLLFLVLGGVSCAAAHANADSFEQALVKAYESNPVLSAERAKLRQFDEQVSQALANWRPSVDAHANVGKIIRYTPDNSRVASEQLFTARSAGVTVSQPVFRGFRTTAGDHAAEQQVAVQRARLEAAEQQLFLDIGTVYLDIVRDETILAYQRDYEAALGDELGETRERLSVHDVTRTDLDQSEARMQRAVAGRLQTEIDLGNSRAKYARLVGEMPKTLQRPELPPLPLKSLDEAITLAEKQNPDVVAAVHSTDEARREVALNEGNLLPEIKLVGSAQRQWAQSTIIPGRQDTVQILAQMSAPVYRAGTDYSRVRSAKHVVTERAMRLEEARRKAREQVVSGWQSLLTARQIIEAGKAHSAAAARALRGVSTEMPAGTRDTVDVLNAEQELFEARASLARAIRDEAAAILQVRSAVGALTAKALSLPVRLYDPEPAYQEARSKWIGVGEEVDQAQRLKMPGEE
jgi:outer membrane protein